LHSTVIVLCPQGVEQGQRPALRKGSRMKPHLRTLYVAMALAIAPAAAVQAQVNFGISIGVPGVQIGINTPYYPELVQVPGYPVYYAPQASANIFFYDGLYWVYAHDDWYASTWYNGPWQLTPREYVPLYVLRVPVRYYRQPPVYFSGWYLDAPPRWGHHWGHDWERRRAGWDRWDRRHVPRPAPLPAYQQRYSGDRYPGAIEQQRAIRAEHDRYRPREQFNRQIMERSAPTGHPEAHRHEPRGDDRGERRGDDRGDGRVHGRNDDRTGGRGDWRQDGRSEGRGPTPQPRVVNTAPPAPPPVVLAPPAPPAPSQAPQSPRVLQPPRAHEQAQQPPRPHRAQPQQPNPAQPVETRPTVQRGEPRGQGGENRGRRDDERGQDRR
jgi:hypothetical protein